MNFIIDECERTVTRDLLLPNYRYKNGKIYFYLKNEFNNYQNKEWVIEHPLNWEMYFLETLFLIKVIEKEENDGMIIRLKYNDKTGTNNYKEDIRKYGKKIELYLMGIKYEELPKYHKYQIDIDLEDETTYEVI